MKTTFKLCVGISEKFPAPGHIQKHRERALRSWRNEGGEPLSYRSMKKAAGAATRACGELQFRVEACEVVTELDG